MRTLSRTARLLLDRIVRRRGFALVPLVEQRAADPWLSQVSDDSVPLPPEAEAELRRDNDYLVKLQEAYGALDWPVCDRSRWQAELMDSWWDLPFFRGDTPFVWHYRENEQVSQLKFFVYLNYVINRDPHGLLQRLGEDGLFGCWTYKFPGYPTCSRDLLDSVNELNFLNRHLSVISAPQLRVVDIGAGYGRLAHRLAQAAKGLTDYCCLDTIPESTFLCDYYTKFRRVAPPVRVIPLPSVPQLRPETFDIAFNVHSFSECSQRSIAWWMAQLRRLEVPHLFLVPNEPEGFLSLESDGSRLEYGQVIADAGYRLIAEQRALADDAVRELLKVEDRFCLFERST